MIRLASLLSTCAAFLLLNPYLAADQVTIDGRFSDWEHPAVQTLDPQGDASGGFDLGAVALRSAGSWLYLHFDIGNEINLQSGDRDDGTLQLLVDVDEARRLVVDFRMRKAYMADDPETTIPWSELGMATQPTFASNLVEMRLNLARFDIGEGDNVRVQFGESDELDEPLEITLQEFIANGTRRIDRLNANDIRVVSMNTWNQGASDPMRSPAIRRLLDFSQGDIFCFQEERDEDSFREAIPGLLPGDPRGDLSVHWSNGCAVATHLPMRPIEMDLDRGAAAFVELEGGWSVVVISVHLKCCGYAGSIEDQLRIDQAIQIANEVERLRNGDFGADAASAGVVLVGDYNLVGTRQPLREIEKMGLFEQLLVELVDNTSTTWRGGADETFWPGRLDIASFDAERLQTGHGFLIDTANHDEEWLELNGLQKDDSSFSDHLMSVLDIRRRRPVSRRPGG